MSAPQIIMAVLVATQVIATWFIVDPYESLGNILGVALMQGLIYWGGFWS